MQECRINVTLLESEREALYRLARIERRDTRGQAAVLIRQELERLGLLPVRSPKIQIRHPQKTEANTGS